MLTQEIIAELQKRQYKTFFAGIFSADNIPKKIKHKHFIILNTDFKDGPGKHWYVVVRLHNLLECFDPLGVSEDRKHFISTNLKFAGIHHISFNVTQIQPSISVLCGQFVLLYLFERYHNLDQNLEELLNQVFSENLNRNEELVKSFMNGDMY